MSKCVDCGAVIGGKSHSLAAGNALASEADGAAAPAYPSTLMPPVSGARLPQPVHVQAAPEPVAAQQLRDQQGRVQLFVGGPVAYQRKERKEPVTPKPAAPKKEHKQGKQEKKQEQKAKDGKQSADKQEKAKDKKPKENKEKPNAAEDKPQIPQDRTPSGVPRLWDAPEGPAAASAAARPGADIVAAAFDQPPPFAPQQQRMAVPVAGPPGGPAVDGAVRLFSFTPKPKDAKDPRPIPSAAKPNTRPGEFKAGQHAAERERQDREYAEALAVDQNRVKMHRFSRDRFIHSRLSCQAKAEAEEKALRLSAERKAEQKRFELKVRFGFCLPISVDFCSSIRTVRASEWIWNENCHRSLQRPLQPSALF